MSKQPFLLFKYSDVSVPEINIQFILSKKKKKKECRRKQQLSPPFLLELQCSVEWMNDLKRSSQVDTICFDLYLLAYHWSQLTELRVWLLPAMYKKCEIQAITSWTRGIYSEQSWLKCRIAFSQNIYVCSEFVFNPNGSFFPKKKFPVN